MSFSSVAAFLFATGIINNLDLSYFSQPPKTHWPSTLWPLWYFLLPNLLSSISTSTPFPPIALLVSIIVDTQHSLRNVLHSITVLFVSLNSCIISFIEKACDHSYMNSRIISSFSFESMSHELCLILNLTSLHLYVLSCLTTVCTFLHLHMYLSLLSFVNFSSITLPQLYCLLCSTQGPGHVTCEHSILFFFMNSIVLSLECVTVCSNSLKLKVKC